MPQPPGISRLSLGPAHSQPAAGAGQPPQRTIPIRNLAPPPPKKSNAALKYAGIAIAVVVVGAGGVYGFLWLHQAQQKANEKSRAAEANSSGESQAGHIANLNAALDATAPGHSLGEMSQHRRAMDQPAAAAGSAASALGADASAPAYTLDLASATIPDSPARGTISGSPFVAESARIDMVGSAHVLQILQGQPASPDREVLVYLHLQPGEALAGKTLSISPDMTGAAVPQVSKRWKPTPMTADTLKAFHSGYAMKLQLGAVTNGAVPGNIFLALPDPEKTVVAGTFSASIIVPQPAQMQMTPVAAPTRRMVDPSTARYGR